MKDVILLSSKFFPSHFRAGEETGFRGKVLDGRKRHTCRRDYAYWKERITTLQEKNGTLCLREWTAILPGSSRQEDIMEVPAGTYSVQPLLLKRDGFRFIAEVEGHPVKLEELARNDGLTPEEFTAWFIPAFDEAGKNELSFAVIQFTAFRY